MEATARALEHLRAQGIAAYRPGVAVGRCRAPYVVVRGGGSTQGRQIVTLYCFVPREGGALAEFAAQVKAEMAALTDQLRPTGNEGPEMTEAAYDARSMTVEYRAMRAQR